MVDEGSTTSFTSSRDQTPFELSTQRSPIFVDPAGVTSSGTEKCARTHRTAHPSHTFRTETRYSVCCASLEVVATGQACEAEDFAGQRFARVGNLKTY